MIEQQEQIWEAAQKDLTRISSLLDVGEEQLRSSQKDLQERIHRLREGLSETEPENRWPLLQELENQKERLQHLQDRIHIYKNKLGSPYFSQIVPGAGYYQDGFFISKHVSDPDNHIIKYTAPLAALRYREIGETETIHDITYRVEKKQQLTIEERELLQLQHSDPEISFVFTQEEFQQGKQEAIPQEIEVRKENLQETKTQPTLEDKKYVLGEIIAQMRKEQDLIMRAPYQGVTLIQGAAGSGKTNMAFHRIVYLVSEHPDRFRQENTAVFCFNVALKKYLSSMLSELNIPRVVVFSLDRWFYSFLKGLTNIGWLDYQEDERTRYLKTRMEILPVLQDFFQAHQEVLQGAVKTTIHQGKTHYHIDAYRILNLLYKYPPFLEHIQVEESYPQGRYPVKAPVQATDQYLLTWLIFLIASEMKLNCFPWYDHVVVDEVQDVLPIQMALLYEIQNHSMTLVGDVSQKIFSSGVDSWDEFNVKIDRIYTLEMCHRSTLQTICFANALLTQDGDRVLSTLVGKQGERPVLTIHPSRQKAFQGAAKTVKQIKKEDPKASVVVVNYRNSDLKNIQQTLSQAGINAYIASRMNWNFSSLVAVTTYHQIKGLEFDYVLILGLNEYQLIPDDRKEQVIYTVITRAQKRVFLFPVQELPEMLQGIDPDLYIQV